MTKHEWQLKHGFDDTDMVIIERTVREVKGKVASVNEQTDFVGTGDRFLFNGCFGTY